jgi:hypothetical protein
MNRHQIIVSVVIFLTSGPALSSGGYDHGTATGKGMLELDFTLNPFNMFEQGQSYVVFGWGIGDRLDLHGYYSVHVEGFNTYYWGLFYQFLNTTKLDLATATGFRTNLANQNRDLFFPQMLYTVKLNRGYSLGGSVVALNATSAAGNEQSRIAIDVALFIPLHRYVALPEKIRELRLSVGLFNPVTNADVEPGQFIPTYSIDVKFGRIGAGRN